MIHSVVIALGTNLGDRAENLAAARLHLAEILSIEKVSHIYETDPWGYSDQPDYLNQVLLGSTTRSVTELLKTLKQIEVEMGREPGFRYGPRLIDLDLLFYDDLIWQTEELTIPHPRLSERAIVLVPLREIVPDWLHPVLLRTVAQLADKVGTEGVRLFADEETIPANQSGGKDMSDVRLKPLKWIPDDTVGFTVERRPDGGMNFRFSSLDPETLDVWRKFALDHLYDSDRLTRNLYDLQAVDELPDEALEIAVEVNSDPSARNIRLAVVASHPAVRDKIQHVADLTPGSGVELRIFEDLDEAEAWLDRPINLLI